MCSVSQEVKNKVSYKIKKSWGNSHEFERTQISEPTPQETSRVLSAVKKCGCVAGQDHYFHCTCSINCKPETSPEGRELVLIFSLEIDFSLH